MVLIAITIKAYRLDSLGLGPFGECTTDRLSRGYVSTVADRSAEILAPGTGFADGYTAIIIDHLSIDMREAPTDRKPRTLCSSKYALADATLSPLVP